MVPTTCIPAVSPRSTASRALSSFSSSVEVMTELPHFVHTSAWTETMTRFGPAWTAASIIWDSKSVHPHRLHFGTLSPSFLVVDNKVHIGFEIVTAGLSGLLGQQMGECRCWAKGRQQPTAITHTTDVEETSCSVPGHSPCAVPHRPCQACTNTRRRSFSRMPRCIGWSPQGYVRRSLPTTHLVPC